MVEAEERNQELGGVAVLEQGRGREVARPPNGMVLDKPNSNYQRGRATVGKGQSFFQAVITLEELHCQETGRVEDSDLGERPGEEIQELHAPNPRHQNPCGRGTGIGDGRRQSQGGNPTAQMQEVRNTGTSWSQKQRKESAGHIVKRQGTKNSPRSPLASQGEGKRTPS